MGKSAPKPPDYGPLAEQSAEAAELSAKLAMDQLDWSKEMWNQQYDIIQDVVGTDLDIKDEQWANSQQDRARWEESFLPVQDKYVSDLESYNPELLGKQWWQERADQVRKTGEEQATRVQADVASDYEAQRQNALRNLEGYGVDPSTARGQALDLGVRLEQAKTQALAASQVRQQAEEQAQNLITSGGIAAVDEANQAAREKLGFQGEAVNVGSGLPSQGLAYSGQALQAGNAAAGNSGAWQGASSAMGSPTTWQGLSNQAVGQGVNTLNTGYNNQLGAFKAEQEYGIGNTLGSIAGTGLGYALTRAEGGEAQAIPTGAVSGPGGPTDDAIPARLSDGEYVIPEKVVRRKGTEFFDKLVQKVTEEQANREQDAQVTATAMGIPPDAGIPMPTGGMG